ncbi:MAG: hypothetical protein QOJ98_3441 [Acidobacteriota bacterium]|jgi:hypothetical protein|nr:hypothetical protein [Acidobacteriota bacterium]
MMYFREQQQFRQGWLWLLFGAISIPIVGVLGYGVYQQLVLGHPFGTNPASNLALSGVFSVILVLHTLVLALFWYARLDVEVHAAELTIRFRPFHLKPRRIPLHAITDARARQYSALGEYGGWGIRMGVHGWAYNVSGDDGVQLTLADGRRILIGSRRSAELEAAIRQAKGM